MMVSDVPQIIESCGFCRAEKVKSLRAMKSGMTNRSYSFCMDDKRYIIRIPGEGTDRLINRKQEHAVYNAISSLGISEDVYYFDPKTGIKIAAYLTDAHVCDSSNWEEVERCLSALKRFHAQKLHVSHSFDLWERLAFYESLWNGAPSVYADYDKTKQTVLSLKGYIDAQPKSIQLCHIDAVPDNFLFVTGKDGSEEIKLTDWEYAGMQDPHLDVAMFIIYALLGVGIVGCTLYIAFSKFGKIKLGDCEKPQYRSFQWGTMIFTSTMAADILFYSLCEWALYANESQVEMMGGMQKWASTYPLFHWGPIAWGFYIVLAVAFGFMIHIRGRDKQKFSEACRPLLGSRVDGVLGRVIDLTAIFALIAGTATTFSLATPLLSRAISRVFGLQDSIGLTIAILLMIAAVYTFTVWFGMKGIAKLAAICSYCFFALLAYVLFGGGETRYILETGFSAIGNLVQNFIGLSTWMDPLRETSFPQNWTIYYWAYWMVWCVATPFFIGVISKGRTIRNTILGGYGWGLAGTFTSFIILGNYGLAQQLKHGLDITGFVAAGGDYSEAIMKIFDTLPLTEVGLILLAVTMIAFYSTTFDALTMVVSSYSYKRLKPEQEPDKRVRTFWAVVFILLPIALIFSENSMHSLQSVSIIAAFPIGIIILIIVASFFRDASGYLQERKDTQA